MAPETAQSGEIDIFEVIETILEQKVAVVLTALAVLALAVAYAYFVPAKQRATITILPPSYAEVSKYANLNNLLPQQIQTDQKAVSTEISLLDLTDTARPKPFVTAEKMEEVFGNTLASYSSIRQALLTENAALSQIDDVEERFEQLAELTRDYEVFSPDLEDGRPFWTVRVETRNTEEAARVVALAFDLNLEEVRQDFLEEAQQTRDALASEVAVEAEDARNALELAKYAYGLRLASRLSFLEEQARLARSLGIEDRQFEARTGDNLGVSLVVGMDQSGQQSRSEFSLPRDAAFPYYLHGYRAIEQELAILRARADDSFQQYAPDAAQLMVALRGFELDQTASRIDAAIAQSPLADGSFTAAVYNARQPRFNKVVGTAVFLVAALIVGLVAGVLVALLRAGLRGRSAARQAA